MKRLSAFIVFILLVAFFVSAEPSINDLISEMPADKIEAFFNGETIEMYSLDGEYVPSIAMDGSMGKSKALKDYEKDKLQAKSSKVVITEQQLLDKLDYILDGVEELVSSFME